MEHWQKKRSIPRVKSANIPPLRVDCPKFPIAGSRRRRVYEKTEWETNTKIENRELKRSKIYNIYFRRVADQAWVLCIHLWIIHVLFIYVCKSDQIMNESLFAYAICKPRMRLTVYQSLCGMCVRSSVYVYFSVIYSIKQLITHYISLFYFAAWS